MISDIVRASIAEHGQSHILKYYDEGKLSEEEKACFESQVNMIDFDRLQKIYEASMSQTAASSSDAQLDPMDRVFTTSYVQYKITDVEKLSPSEIDDYRNLALSAICNGEIGLVLMAGGQGTRLGCTFPKGEYDIDLISHKPLFQLQAERIRRIEDMAFQKFGKRVTIPWYVMTSPMTHTDTLAYILFVFFSQGTLPCMDNNGLIIMSSRNEISTAPDGNGGIFMAFHKSIITIDGVEISDQSVIDHMQKHGVKYVQIYGVDNAIVRVPDPVMYGLFIKEGDDAGNKCVAKNGPNERVGVVCKKEGKYNVVEYSELSDMIANMRDKDGELVYSAGFICNLYYTVDFLSKKCNPENLPLLYHVAHKAIPYYDETSNTVMKPKSPNGVKMESFIFDVFPFSEKMGCLLVPRSEFTPVKNSNETGFDCPDSARKIMTETFIAWLKVHGCEFDGVVDATCLEISPLLSFAGENLERLAGKKLQLPCLISNSSEITKEDLSTAIPFCDGVVSVKREYTQYVFV